MSTADRRPGQEPRALENELRDAARELVEHEHSPDLVAGVLAALPPRQAPSAEAPASPVTPAATPAPSVGWPLWLAAASLLAALTITALDTPEPTTPAAPVADASPTMGRTMGPTTGPSTPRSDAAAGPSMATAVDPTRAPRPPMATSIDPDPGTTALSLMQGAPAAVLSWLPDSRTPLLSSALEQPLLDEVDGLSQDAQRAAAAVLGPLVEAWSALRGGLALERGPL